MKFTTAILFFILTALLSAGKSKISDTDNPHPNPKPAHAQNATAATSTISLTKTIYRTKIISVDLTTPAPTMLPPYTIETSSVGPGDTPASEARSAVAQATPTSTNVVQITATSVSHVGITVTDTAVVAGSPAAPAATSIPVEVEIAQMWGLNGGGKLEPSKWFMFGLFVFAGVQNLFFAQY